MLNILLARVAAAVVAMLTALVVTMAQAASPAETCFNYLKAQDYPRAIESGREAVRLSPRQGDVHFCLGRAYMNVGDFDAALRALQQAERLYSSKADLEIVYASLGHIAYAKGDLQQALNYYSRQLGLARDRGDRRGEAAGLNNVALIFYGRGDSDKALDYYQQALKIEPSEAGKVATYNNIALVYTDKEDYSHAIEYLDRAIAQARRNGDYHGAAQCLLNKGGVQTSQGRYDAAQSTLDEGLVAIRKANDKAWEADAYGYLGDLAAARGDLERAQGHYREALRLARAAGADNAAQRYARKLAGMQKTLATTSYGVIEIGSKGVKAAVVSAVRDAQGRPKYEAGFRKSVNTNVIQGVAESGEFSAQAMDDTAQAVKELAQAMRAASTNLGERIYVVASSAVGGAMNRDALTARVGSASGLTVRFINSAEEMGYALKVSIDEKLIYKSVLVDIGSGNGRIGYLIHPRGGQPEGQAVIDLRAGSVTLTDLANAARKPGEDYVPALNRVVEADFAPRFASDVKQYPVLERHRHWLFVGGAAWALATLMHPEDQSGYVKLSAQDLRDYYERLSRDPERAMNPGLDRIADAKLREKAAQQIESVKKVFTRDNLLAGARLLKLVADTAPFGKAEIWFARDGGWAYGLAEALASVEREAK